MLTLTLYLKHLEILNLESIYRLEIGNFFLYQYKSGYFLIVSNHDMFLVTRHVHSYSTRECGVFLFATVQD